MSDLLERIRQAGEGHREVRPKEPCKNCQNEPYTEEEKRLASERRKKAGQPVRSANVGVNQVHLSFLLCARLETAEDVQMTVDSILAGRSEVDAVDVTVIDDSGDNKDRYGFLADRATVVRHDQAIGRGVSANTGYRTVQGHPVFPDAHMRIPAGGVGAIGRAIAQRAVVCAGVQDITKPAGCQGYGAKYRFHRRGRLGVQFFRAMDPNDGPGPWRVPQPFGGCYGFHRDVFELMDGWTDLAACWGYCEQPIGFMAWALDIPVLAVPIVVAHRFRKVNPCGAGLREVWLNVCYAHAVIFQPRTFAAYWRPILESHISSVEIDGILARRDVQDRHQRFQGLRPKDRTDARFFEEVLGLRVRAAADGGVEAVPNCSIILPANNEGDEVVHTTRSIMASTKLDPEIIHVDDASTDGCCSRKNAAGGTRLDDHVRILQNAQRIGVTRSRMVGARAARESNYLFLDDHTRIGPGDVDKLVRYAEETKGFVVATCCHFRDAKEIVADPPRRNYGSRWCVKPGWGLRGSYVQKRPAETLARANMAMGSGYIVCREIFERMRGWPLLPGKWAYSEQSIALKCFALDIPIFTACDVLVWHKVKDFANATDLDVLLNAHFVHRAYFDEETYLSIWRPILLERGNAPEIDEMLRSKLLLDEAAWFQANRRHTDEEFFRMLGSTPEELLQIDKAGGTAKPTTQAGYIAYEARRSPGREWTADRARMEQRHVPDLLKVVGQDRIHLKLLDVGSRDGWILDVLVRSGFSKENLTGFELSPWAARHARSMGRNVLTGDAHHLEGLRDGEFDVVTHIHCLEHCHTPARVLSEIARVLKPGGLAMVVVPIEPEGLSVAGDHCHAMRSAEAVSALMTGAGLAVSAQSSVGTELTLFARKS